MTTRTWSWLRARIRGVLDTPPTAVFNGRTMTVLPRTRIGWLLDPPTSPEE